MKKIRIEFKNGSVVDVWFSLNYDINLRQGGDIINVSVDGERDVLSVPSSVVFCATEEITSI